jgi:hypothetical protein
MPTSALTRSLATLAVVVALLGATLSAPTAQAADRGDRKAASQTSAPVSERAVLANRALTRAKSALSGRGGDATMALRDLNMLKDALSPADRAAAERLSARPGNKPSTLAAGNVRIHWNPAEMALSTFTPTDVLNTTVSISQLYSSSGYRQPKKDGTKGGDSKTDIYVDSLQPGLYGYCTIDPKTKQPGPGRYDVPAFCVVDNDYLGFPANTPLENLQVTVAHEYFHATQFAYDYFEDGWWMEATAAWVEDEAYDDVDDNVQYLADSPITHNKRSMDKFGGLYHYGVWIFFRYLTETFPKEKGQLPKIILDFWKAADSSKGARKDKYSTQALNAVLGRNSYKKLSFDKAFALFSDANRLAPFTYEEGVANSYPSKKLAGSTALKKGKAKKFTAKLDHLSSSTYRYAPKGSKARKLKVAISGPAKIAGTRAVVSIWTKAGKVKQKYVPISAKGRGALTVPFKASEITAVEVTLVNASTRYIRCFPPQNYSPFACGGRPVDQKRLITVLAKAV